MSGETVLIVEDEGIVAMGIDQLLRRNGYRVTGIAANAEKALEMTAQHDPDIILMDIKLQGKMDGIETARILLERHNKRVVYLTGLMDSATTQRAADTNPLGIIEKPMVDSTYIEAIEEAIKVLYPPTDGHA